MVLVHDNALAWLHGIHDSTVRRRSIQYTIVLMYSFFQPLDGLQSDVVISHIRSLKPTVHNARIGELFRYRNFSITHSGGAHPKALSSAHNSTSADTESVWVGTLSNIFEKRCEFHVFLRPYLGYITSDSSVIDNRLTSKSPRQAAVTSGGTFSALCKLWRDHARNHSKDTCILQAR